MARKKRKHRSRRAVRPKRKRRFPVSPSFVRKERHARQKDVERKREYKVQDGSAKRYRRLRRLGIIARADLSEPIRHRAFVAGLSTLPENWRERVCNARRKRREILFALKQVGSSGRSRRLVKKRIMRTESRVRC